MHHQEEAGVEFVGLSAGLCPLQPGVDEVPVLEEALWVSSYVMLNYGWVL